MGFFSKRNTDKQPAGPTSSAGGPVYDATYHPADATERSEVGLRLQAQRDLHLFYDKSAAAQAFSHYYSSTPSPVTVAMMGLAAQRDQIARLESRKQELPFPGVALGNLPAFSRSPDTTPQLRGVQHLTFGAHNHESLRAGRARFNR